MRCHSGFTLVEVMVATSMFSSVMVITLSFMTTMTDAASAQQRRAVLLQAKGATMDTLSDTLRTVAIPAGVFDGGNAVTSLPFQVPVQGADGRIVDVNDACSVRWGVRREGEYFEGEYAVLRFVPTGTLNESDVGVDLNGNGDTADVYQLGHLEQAQFASADLTGTPLQAVALTPDVVVQFENDPAADLDGDDVPDPLFAMESADVVRATVVFADLEAAIPTLHRASTAIRLLNAE